MAFTKTAGVEYGTPAVVLSTTAASGSNQTAIRTDGQIIAFSTDVPEDIAYGQSAATGSDAVAARLDHDHGMAAAIPQTSGYADVSPEQTTTSTAFTDLTTVGPAVTLSPGSTQDYLIWVACSSKTSNPDYYGAFMGVSIAGAAALNANAGASYTGSLESNCWPVVATSVANGSTHTAKYRVENAAATGSYIFRRIVAATT